MATLNTRGARFGSGPFRAGPAASLTAGAASVAYAMGPYSRVQLQVPSGRAVRLAAGGPDVSASATTSRKLDGGTAVHELAIPPYGYFALTRDTAEVSDVSGVIATFGN